MRWHRNLASWDSGVSNSLPLSASHTFAHLSQLAVALRHESGFKWIELQYLLGRDSCASFCTCENYQVRQFQETLQFLTIDILLGQVRMHTVGALWDYSGKAPGLIDRSHLVSNPAPRFALPAALLVILTSRQKLISIRSHTSNPSLINGELTGTGTNKITNLNPVDGSVLNVIEGCNEATSRRVSFDD